MSKRRQLAREWGVAYRGLFLWGLSKIGEYLSNRPHFLRVYQRDNPREMLGEHEKSL